MLKLSVPVYDQSAVKRNYFLITSISILILSFIGFSDNLITDIHQKSNYDPKFIIHGLFCFAWMILLVTQAYHIRKGNFASHKKLAIAGAFIAAGTIVSTTYVFVAIFESWGEMFFIAKANRFFMASYTVLIILAYINRKIGEKHKRYIYLATLYMLAPILDRVAGKLGMDAILFTPLIWNLLFISFFMYDWVILKRIHPITYLGLGWFYTVWVIAVFS